MVLLLWPSVMYGVYNPDIYEWEDDASIFTGKPIARFHKSLMGQTFNPLYYSESPYWLDAIYTWAHWLLMAYWSVSAAKWAPYLGAVFIFLAVFTPSLYI